MIRRVVPLLLVALVLAACGDEASVTPAAAPAYVAASECTRCHTKEHRVWTGSHHDLAMQVATEETVLGDFDDATFEKDGVITRFIRDGDRFVVNTEGPGGAMHDYVVTHVFGIDPLQQYLVGLGGGHIHVLPTCWDVHEKRWFHVYAEPIPHDDPLFWTGPYMNWNYMCAECHTTSLDRGYDLETDTYHTTWSEGHVSCQACHGPGSDHVAWAERVKDTAGAYAEDDPKGLVVDLGAADSHVQIETCARCHARRNLVSGAFGHGDPLLDHYDPELLVAPLYFPDGQILDEVYVYGSFLQSKKYARGVRCTNCHDPHTARPKTEGNALCARCHRPDPPVEFPTLRRKVYDGPEHHHHPAGSDGALCVSCHMPDTTYMRVDPRRDHGFRVPRPDLSAAVGVPNPCTTCHASEDNAWAEARIATWFPDGRVAKKAPHFATTFAAARAGKTSAVAGLVAIVRDDEQPAIVRATAVRELGRFGSPLVLETAVARLEDAEALVRLAAVHLLSEAAGAGLPAPVRAQVATRLLPRLEDERRVIRGEAARALAPLRASLPETSRDAFERALAEYVARQEALSDRADAWLNLGSLYAALGDASKAESAYRTALKVDPGFLPVRFNLANLLNARGANDEAETLLREILARMPEQGEAHYSLGLLLAEGKRYGDAARSLSRAATLMPGRPRVHYNRALVLQRLGRDAEAETALRKAHDLAPRDPRIVEALAVALAQRGRWREARTWARKLVDMTQGSPDARRLLEYVESRGQR